jgi:NADP-dependent 3-hydroxy acid dehydrogenase YdfG
MEFVAQGAEVLPEGRPNRGLEELAKPITAAGGRAHIAVMDAEDAAAIDGYIEGIVHDAGRIHVVCIIWPGAGLSTTAMARRRNS